MKSNHFSNRDSLKDAMKNLGVKHSDVDMSNKRMPVSMSIEEVIEKPRPFKKGGMAKMPADKLHRLVKPCKKMPCPKTPRFSKGGMSEERAEKEEKGSHYNQGGMCSYKHGGMCGTNKSRKSK